MKKEINLLLKKKQDSLILQKIRVISPILSVIVLFLVLVVYFIINSRLTREVGDLERVVLERKNLENMISSNKAAETSYVLTEKIALEMDAIQKSSPNFDKPFPFLTRLTEGIFMDKFTLDKNGRLNMTIAASESANLSFFVEKLMEAEREEQLISQVRQSGVSRDTFGNYTLNLDLILAESLL